LRPGVAKLIEYPELSGFPSRFIVALNRIAPWRDQFHAARPAARWSTAMNGISWTGDEAFRRELGSTSKSRLKLRISAGALIAIVSASYVLQGLLDDTAASNGLALFGLAFGLYVAAHYSLLLVAKRNLA
jgi:hypothetical protein